MSQAWTEPRVQGSALFWLPELSMGKSTSWVLLITVKIGAFRASAWILVPVIVCSVAEMQLAGKLIDSRNNSYISLSCFVIQPISHRNTAKAPEKHLKSFWRHMHPLLSHRPDSPWKWGQWRKGITPIIWVSSGKFHSSEETEVAELCSSPGRRGEHGRRSGSGSDPGTDTIICPDATDLCLITNVSKF